jgi:hypothetical protein
MPKKSRAKIYHQSSDRRITGKRKGPKPRPVEDGNNENDDQSEDNGTFVTPPPKRQRVLNDTTNTTATAATAATAASSPNSTDNSNGNPNVDLLSLSPDELASKIAEVLEHFCDNPEDMAHIMNLFQYEIEDWAPTNAVVGDGTPGSTLPIKTAKKSVTPVTYNPNIFKFSIWNAEAPVTNEHTQKTNLGKLQRMLRSVLDQCGTDQHQMFLIHKVLTHKSKAGIGLGLGLLKEPDKDVAAKN